MWGIGKKRSTWDRIKRNVLKFDKKLIANLRPGADPHAIKALEDLVGQKLEDSFVDFYLEHDGQEIDDYSIFSGCYLMNIEEIITCTKEWSSLSDMNEELSKNMVSLPAGFIKPVYGNAPYKWIPFIHDGGGNHIGIDLGPDKKGTIGQIILFGRDEDTKRLAANSFSEFIEDYIYQLKKGNFGLFKVNVTAISPLKDRRGHVIEDQPTHFFNYYYDDVYGAEPTPNYHINWSCAVNDYDNNNLRKGDIALAAILRTNREIEMHGLEKAIERLPPNKFEEAIEGCKYFNLAKLADILSEAAKSPDKNYNDLYREYAVKYIKGRNLFELFIKKYEETPDDFFH